MAGLREGGIRRRGSFGELAEAGLSIERGERAAEGVAFLRRRIHHAEGERASMGRTDDALGFDLRSEIVSGRICGGEAFPELEAGGRRSFDFQGAGFALRPNDAAPFGM